MDASNVSESEPLNTFSKYTRMLSLSCIVALVVGSDVSVSLEGKQQVLLFEAH